MWWQVFQGSALVIIASLGVYIAWQQHQTARTKLQLDLYERRYGVFNGVKGLLRDVGREGAASFVTLTAFDEATADADFLFGDEVVTYIAAMRTRAFDLHRANIKVRDLRHPERKDAIDAEMKLMMWFVTQYDECRRTFRPFMSLDARGNKGWWRPSDTRVAKS